MGLSWGGETCMSFFWLEGFGGPLPFLQPFSSRMKIPPLENPETRLSCSEKERAPLLFSSLAKFSFFVLFPPLCRAFFLFLLSSCPPSLVSWPLLFLWSVPLVFIKWGWDMGQVLQLPVVRRRTRHESVFRESWWCPTRGCRRVFWLWLYNVCIKMKPHLSCKLEQRRRDGLWLQNGSYKWSCCRGCSMDL